MTVASGVGVTLTRLGLAWLGAQAGEQHRVIS